MWVLRFSQAPVSRILCRGATATLSAVTVINFSEVEYCALPQLRFKFKFQVKV